MEETKQLTPVQVQAQNLYSRFVDILTKKGEISVAMTEGGLDRGVIKMSDRQKEAFEKYKDSSVLHGIKSYLEARFDFDKLGAKQDAKSNYEQQADLAEQHGWHMTGTSRYAFGFNSLIGNRIEDLSSSSMKSCIGEESCAQIQSSLQSQQETLAVDAIAEGYEKGLIPEEVGTMSDVELWEHATSGGFAEVEKLWAANQQVALKQAEQMEEAAYAQQNPQ